MQKLKTIADDMIKTLSTISGIRNCTLYGSLAACTADEFSDIDIEIDVSGKDNGLFMLKLPHMLRKRMPVYYFDFAPSLAPEKYVISMAIDEENPFRMVDITVTADPHCATVSKQLLMDRNDPYSHALKLWTANLKHYVRGAECRSDMEKMARKLNLDTALSSAEILGETLNYLEENTPETMTTFIASCRAHFEKLI